MHNIRVKCKHCGMILTTQVKSFQTCECGKVMFDTDNVEYYTRILGNEKDYEIITST